MATNICTTPGGYTRIFCEKYALLQGAVVHYNQDRMVTPRECARLMGFDDKFKFTGASNDQIRQIGNAVPPPLAEEIGRSILKSLLL